VTSVAPFSAGQTIWVDATSDAEQVTIASVGTAGATGTGLTLAAPLTKAYASGRPAYVTLTTPSISYICWTDAQGVLNTSGPNARRSTRAYDAHGPGGVVRPRPGQRVGSDGGLGEPGVHGDRDVRPADRPRPHPQLGPQPDHHRRGTPT
jgi:hypothetical protein